MAVVVLLYWAAMLLLGLYLRISGDASPAGMLLAFGPRWALLLPWLLLVLLAWRAKGVLLMALGGAATTALVVAGFEVPSFTGDRAGAAALRVVTYNTDGSQTLAGRIQQDLAEWRADVVVFQDCPQPLAQTLQRIEGARLDVANEICVLSRLPVEKFEPMAMPTWDDRRTRAVRIDLKTPDGVVTVVGVHFASPRTALNAARLRNFGMLQRSITQRGRISRQVREWTLRTPHPLIVAGDFNMPQGSVLLRRDWGSLQNAFSERGWGFGHTMRVGVFAVRIDHVFVTQTLVPTNVRVFSGYPSEHQPVLVDIAWRAQ